MYTERGFKIKKVKSKENQTIDLGTRETSIVPGFIPESGFLCTPLIVKSLRSVDHFRTIIDYFDALLKLQEEKKFLETHTSACPNLIHLLGCESDENGEIKELLLERVLPLADNLKFLKALGLPNLLSVVQGIHDYVAYVHHHHYVDRDMTLANFGLDYEKSTNTYPDGTLLPEIVKRYDLSLLLRQDKLQAEGVKETLEGTPMYMPIYLIQMILDNQANFTTFIKSDIYSTALCFYDLFTEWKRKPLSKQPSNFTLREWMPQLLINNHNTRFTPQDLLFITSTEDRALMLAEKLNQVLAKALTFSEKDTYESVTDLYQDFIYCFKEFLTPAQFERLTPKKS